MTIGDQKKYILVEKFPEMIMDHLPGLDKFIPGQIRQTRPSLRDRCAQNLIDHVELMDFIVALKDWLLCE